jgi:hypothetical protein
MAINKIKTIAIEDSAITSAKIAADNVTSAEIGDNQVGISELNVSDGTNGQVLSTDGIGNLVFSSVSFDNDYVSSLSFNTTNGILTAARGSLSSLTVDLDGRWADSGHTHPDLDTNEYVDSMAWDSGTGVITLGRSGALSDLTLDIDGRYTESGHTHSYLPLSGGNVTGNINLADNVKMTFGTSGDLEIYHDTSNSYISDVGSGDLILKSISMIRLNSSTNESMITAQINGPVDLYYDNAVKISTKTSGALITGNLDATGEVTAYFSDARLKDFEGRIPNPLDKLNELSGYYFKENELAHSLGYSNEDRQVGVSAQEVLNVLPEAVTQAVIDPEYLAVKYDKLVPLLIEAIKELSAQVEKLKK